jgi:hypothetical protein
MTRPFRSLGLTIVLALSSVGLMAQRPNNVDMQRAATIVARIVRNTDTFQRNLDQNAPANRRYNDRTDIAFLVSDFSDSISHLQDHVSRRIALTADVEDALARASAIDRATRANRLNVTAGNSWQTIRRDLDRLATMYDVAWDWNNTGYTPVAPPVDSYHRLSGTYALDRSRSDNAQTVADRATRTLPASTRDRVNQNLRARLEAPETISIDRNESRVTLASSSGQRITFDANGNPQTERDVNGRSITTRATIYGDQIRVDTNGDRGTDFTVTFEPLNNGRDLRVTRQLSSDAMATNVTSTSIYRKTSDQPTWNLPDTRDNNRNNYPPANYPPASYPGSSRSGYGIPNGTRLIATMDSPLDSNTIRDGDRFTLTVQSPSEFDGAVIDGIVSKTSSGGVLNRADMVLNFDRVRLRNGQSYPFSAILESVRMPDGSNVKVNNEGSIGGQGQNDQVITRGAIGAALGGIIGAIAGGGKGAAIGAVLGGAGGASTVFIEGRNDLQMPRGTELSLTVTGGGGSE